MVALYEGVNRVLTGEEQALNYSEAKIEQSDQNGGTNRFTDFRWRNRRLCSKNSSRTKGLNVTIVEKYKLGGTCLHKGCIPKALLRSAEVLIP